MRELDGQDERRTERENKERNILIEGTIMGLMKADEEIHS